MGRDQSKKGLNYPTTRRGRGAAGGGGAEGARQLLVPIVILAVVAVAGGFAVKWLIGHSQETTTSAVPPPSAPIKTPQQPQPQIQAQPTPQPQPQSQVKTTPPAPTPRPANPQLDAQQIAQLKQNTDDLAATDLANVNIGWMNARIANLRSQAATLYARQGENADLRQIAQKLDDLEAKVAAKVASSSSIPTPSATKEPTPQTVAQPTPMQNGDAVSQAVADLQDTNFQKKRDALRTLAKTPHDPTRPDVTRALETILLADDGGTRDDAAKALANWADEQTVLKMLPWLDENSPAHHVGPAMTVLAATKDKRAVFPILRWIIKEPENVVTALTTIGPVAEDEVVKVLRERDPIARKNAARILQDIGGQKSLMGLQRAAADPRDASAATAAKIALEIVRERVKQSKPTTQS